MFVNSNSELGNTLYSNTHLYGIEDWREKKVTLKREVDRKADNLG